MKRDATPISEVAGKFIQELTGKRAQKNEKVREAWHKAAGPKFQKHTQPTSFRKKTLVVNVDSSGWLYELTMNKVEIIARLKKSLKDDFKELRFRIGKIDR